MITSEQQPTGFITEKEWQAMEGYGANIIYQMVDELDDSHARISLGDRNLYIEGMPSPLIPVMLELAYPGFSDELRRRTAGLIRETERREQRMQRFEYFRSNNPFGHFWW